LKNPVRIGMPTRKTIAVPCTVISRLKTWGGTMPAFGTASWRRIVAAWRPAMTKKSSAKPMYMRPRRSWSTVVTHSWSRPSTGISLSGRSMAASFSMVDMRSR